jgi:hypothetical protein
MQAASPCAKSLLKDPLHSDNVNPLIIWNINGNSTTKAASNGVLGVFHLSGYNSWRDPNIGDIASLATIQVQPADIPVFRKPKYAQCKFLIRLFFGRQCFIVDNPESSIAITLAPMRTEAVSVFPVLTVGDFELIILGLRDKINGGGAVLSVDILNPSTISFDVRGNGKFECAIRQVTSSSKRFNAIFLLNDVPLQPSSDQRTVDDASPRSMQWYILNHGFALFSFDLPPCQWISANVKLLLENVT